MGYRIVATLYSRSINDEVTKNECLSSKDSAAAAGYFDLGNYSACKNGIPVCKNGSRKIIQSMTQEGSKIKYHTNCIVDTSSTGDVIVATIYSSSVNAVNTCKTAASGDAQAVGYFDLGNYAYCDATNTPQCRGGARKIILSDSQDNQGNVKYHTDCVL